MSKDLVPVQNLPADFKDFSKFSQADLQKLSGQQVNDTGNMLPRLRVNYDAEYVPELVEGQSKDPEPITLPRGAYKITIRKAEDELVTLFDKNPIFRPFINTYRYSAYDQKNKVPIMNSTLFKGWGDAVIDDLGGEFKAAAYKKKFVLTFPQYKEVVKCIRVMFGTVTMPNAKDMHGNAFEVVNVPCMWSSKGSSFMPIGEALDSLTKQGKMLANWPMVLSTKRERNDGTTYFVAQTEFDKEVPFTKEDFELFKDFQLVINSENEQIIRKYKEVKAKEKNDNFAERFASGTLDDDLSDFGDLGDK